MSEIKNYTKKMLVLECCGHSDEPAEIKSIMSNSSLYGYSVEVQKPKCQVEFIESLKSGIKYDYIYLSAHGNANEFGNNSNIRINWLEFGAMICETECLKSGGILLLSCCRGGLNEIAYDMFFSCPFISYICGPRQSVLSVESIIGFNILLYNIIYRDVDPLVACEKIKLGTDIRFKCFDRSETISDINYLEREKINKRKTTLYYIPEDDEYAVKIFAPNNIMLGSETTKEDLETIKFHIDKKIRAMEVTESV